MTVSPSQEKFKTGGVLVTVKREQALARSRGSEEASKASPARRQLKVLRWKGLD